MESQSVLELFEEVESVKNSEGAEALTEARINELCKKYDISMTELNDLVIDILSACEIKKFSSNEDALENVAGGKMDFKKGTATLLAALNVAGPFASSTFATPLDTQQYRRPITAAHARRNVINAQNLNQDPTPHVKNDGGAIKFVQNTFGVSHTIATGIVGTTKVLVPVLALAGIYTGVNGLISNKSAATDPYAAPDNDQQKQQLCTLPATFTSDQFKDWLVVNGAIDLSDDKYETVHDLITALKSCNNTYYPKNVSEILLFQIFNSPRDNACNMQVASIARSPRRHSWFPTNSGNLSCGGILSKSRSFVDHELRLLLDARAIPVIIVNDAVMTDVCTDTSKAYPESVIRDSEGNPSMFACAPDILNAFNNTLQSNDTGSTPPARSPPSPSENSGSHSGSNGYEASDLRRKDAEHSRNQEYERKRKEEEERKRKETEERIRKEEKRKRKEEEERKRKDEEERIRDEEERTRQRQADLAAYELKKEATAREEIEEKILRCPRAGTVIELTEEQTVGSITQAALHLREFVLIQYTKGDVLFGSSRITFFAPTQNQATIDDINRVSSARGRYLSHKLDAAGWGYTDTYASLHLVDQFAETIATNLHLPVIILQHDHLHPLLMATSGRKRKDFIDTLHSIDAQTADMDSIRSACRQLSPAKDLALDQIAANLNQLRDRLSDEHMKSFLTAMISALTKPTFPTDPMPAPDPIQVAQIPACDAMLSEMKVLWYKSQHLATEAAARKAEATAKHQWAKQAKRAETEELMSSVTIPETLLSHLECIPRKYENASEDVNTLTTERNQTGVLFMTYRYEALNCRQQLQWGDLFRKATAKRTECNKYLAEAIIGIRDSLAGKGFSDDVLTTLTSLVNSNTYIPENLPEDFYDNFGTTVGPLLQDAHDSLIKLNALCDLCSARQSNIFAQP